MCVRAHVQDKEAGVTEVTQTRTTKFLMTSHSLKARRNFWYKQNLWNFFHISIGGDGEFSILAKYYYGMVRRRKCSMRVIAVLGEGISLEGQVCSNIDFSGNECSCHLGKDKREKSLGKYRK